MRSSKYSQPRSVVASDADDGRSITKKVSRLERGAKPRVLDLFSGCGGLSLGFQAAGCEIRAAVELDIDAARSHGTNFHSGDESHTKARDITQTSPAELADALNLGKARDAFDVIVGGPPCQAFARVGRSKLREVADHPEAFRHDHRARLYIDYLEYVKCCSPLAVVLENVPDMLNFGGHNIAQEVCEVLSKLGYVCGFTLLNAAYYGVPQMRERAFLLGIRKELAKKVQFPKPTHWIELPSGYEGSRAVARKLLAERSSRGFESFWEPPFEPERGLPPAVTAKDALQDLPEIKALDELQSGRLKRGRRKFDLPISYAETKKISEFARSMRNWPGFEARCSVYDHVIRYLPRDYKLFAKLNGGDQYPEAFRIAKSMFEDKLLQLRRAGEDIPDRSRAWKTLKESIVPPYDHTKFPNKWRKMEPDQPARTLMAHLGKDSYSHIHYDSTQARTISVREAARLQSFPDGFIFCGTMNPAFRQIGNAVPPLLAKAIGVSLVDQLRSAVSNRLDFVA